MCRCFSERWTAQRRNGHVYIKHWFVYVKKAAGNQMSKLLICRTLAVVIACVLYIHTSGVCVRPLKHPRADVSQLHACQRSLPMTTWWKLREVRGFISSVKPWFALIVLRAVLHRLLSRHPRRAAGVRPYVTRLANCAACFFVSVGFWATSAQSRAAEVLVTRTNNSLPGYATKSLSLLP